MGTGLKKDKNISWVTKRTSRPSVKKKKKKKKKKEEEEEEEDNNNNNNINNKTNVSRY